MRPACAGLLAGLVAASAAIAGDDPEAITIEAGSVVRRQVVALGRDLVVAGEASTDVAVIGGSVRLDGHVGGDLIVLGGDARLGAGARVGGDIFVLGGKVDAAGGARVAGRSVAYPGAPSTWLVLLEGPSLGLSATSPVVLGAKLALLAAWMAASLLLLSTSGEQLLRTAESVRREPFRDLFVGLVAVLALVLSVLLFSALASAVIGVPLLVLAALFALLLKLWGTVAVFVATGQVVLEWLGRRRELPLTAAAVGLVLFGAVKLLPWLGVWVWTLVTLTGVGASLLTKFGRQEAWFELARLEA